VTEPFEPAGAEPVAAELRLTVDAVEAGEPVAPSTDAVPAAVEALAPTADAVPAAVETIVAGVRAEPVAVEPEPSATPALSVAAVPAPIAAVPASVEVIPAVETAPADAVLLPLDAIAPAIAEASLSRRAFLGFGLALAGGIVGAGALGQLFPVFADGSAEINPLVPSYDPKSHAWTFVVDTARCIGCGLCVVACKEENHVPESPQYTRTWIERHVRTADGTLYVDSPDAGINGFPADSTAPGAAGKAVESSFFQPRLCMQCEDSPCTAVCPVSATYRTEDGIILVDARRCIGCGYCVTACPYGARYLTPAGERDPNDTPGVADKCTWCYHRITRGQQPACVEICPAGARRFGDANDPSTGIAALVATTNPQPLHPEYGTRPRVLYLGPTLAEA
jgi:Fe-S-cluster-containing dehydrogenase component